MTYRGMENAADREALLIWLASTSNAKPTADISQNASVSTDDVLAFASEILNMEGDKEYGEYLSGDCVTCHQISGKADGIPSIIGLPEDYFVKALIEYKIDVRNNEVMKNRVTNLSNEEVAALAAYFSDLQPQ